MNRKLPWLVAAAAYTVPPLWAFLSIERDQSEQTAIRGWACGMPALGIVLLACVGSAALSLAAAALRGRAIGWWKSASPTATRSELAALLFPFVGAIGFGTHVFLG
ncbi:MAG: hypothetical protein HY302_11875 [Opitutae bacterium]|nr:hypothetical protein [Opitutae bacterium]